MRITTHPGEMLREEFMNPLGLSARALARALEVPHNRISELIAGRRSMTADTALRLEKYFGMEARFWLNLQASHDLSTARREGHYESIKPREAA
jgi:addiction module HigA family antidote